MLNSLSTALRYGHEAMTVPPASRRCSSRPLLPTLGPVSEPRWLDDDEMRLWRAFVEVSGGVVQRLDVALKCDADLTLDDYEVLVHLSETHDQRLRMSDLSVRLLHSQSRVTQRVDRLARRGLVERERCTDDRRVIYAVLTDEGRKTIAMAAPDHVVQVRRWLIDRIEPEEASVMLKVYERLIDALRAERG